MVGDMEREVLEIWHLALISLFKSPSKETEVRPLFLMALSRN